MKNNQFSADLLQIDPAKEVEKICERLREFLTKKLKRRGLVVALSGGIDSSVTTALAARANLPCSVYFCKKGADQIYRSCDRAGYREWSHCHHRVDAV